MLRKLKAIICFLAIVFLLASCQQAAGTPTPTPDTPEAASTSSSASTASPTPVPTAMPVFTSYTTGLPADEQAEYKPVGVMVENSPAARPQSGLQAADIVYEAPVEGCTRFFCIYNDVLPTNVGPVRSARLYYIKIQQEWDCAYVHFGGPESGKSNVYLASSEHIDTRINFIKGGFNAYYWRIKTRSSPHNAYTDVQKCQELMEEEATPRPFEYNAEYVYPGENVSKIKLPFYTGEVTYLYDAQRDLFMRYMGDEAFTDAETGQAIEIKNIIVQYNRFYHGNEKKGRWLCDLLGSGDADFFIGGKHISGTWERESYESQTIYRDSAENEIVLRPGNTWIAVHPQGKEITVEY